MTPEPPMRQRGWPRVLQVPGQPVGRAAAGGGQRRAEAGRGARMALASESQPWLHHLQGDFSEGRTLISEQPRGLLLIFFLIELQNVCSFGLGWTVYPVSKAACVLR